ncbi:hypothetical protein [Streptomyces sp. NPDC048606]|uniref:hypothetical protein n=1 Tax=Streptomyces sp. NPDC048606 TaxID=3154726 RepID=UPI00341C2745
MNAMKRTLSALVLSGGAALALTPGAALAAEGPDIQGPPIVKRVTDVVDHPAQTVQDTKTALEVTAGAADSASKATNSSLAGAGTALSAGMPQAPKAG